MKRTRAWTLALAVAVGLFGASLGQPAPQASAGESEGWVCPPCSCGGDERVHDAAGTCPLCGMKLVRRGGVPEPKPRPRAAILVFEGVQIIDYTGPYEVFGQGGYDVYTVARTKKPITTAMGMSVNPTHSFETGPAAAVLIVPGGHVEPALEDPATITWVQQMAEDAEHVLSVCNGAFILAKAGLLEGGKATTFYGLIDELKAAAPNTEIVSDQRFVDNGKVITSAGLSSGIDASFHVLERVRGRGEAQRVALHMEYQWDPESRFARAALPDRLVPPLERLLPGHWRLLETSGSDTRWETRWSVKGAGSPGELRQSVESHLGGAAGWSRRGGQPGRTEWMFREGGAAWRALSHVGPNPKTGVQEVRIAIEKAGRAR